MSRSKSFFETFSAAWHTTTSYWKKDNNHMPFLSLWDNFRLRFSFFAFFLKTNSLSPGRKYEACKRGSEIWYSRLPQTRKRAISEKKIRIDKAPYIRLFPSPLHFLAMQGYKKKFLWSWKETKPGIQSYRLANPKRGISREGNSRSVSGQRCRWEKFAVVLKCR